MDVIEKYIPDINKFQNRHKACEELLKKFMQNYNLIVEESDSLFICKYFMSAILGFCADIGYDNCQLLEQFFRFFVNKQSGIWDIWSVYDFCDKRWISMETCLGIRFERLREEPRFGLNYIIAMAHKLNIVFTDPMDTSVSIRFIDFPRFDAIQSKSDLWRNLHRPVIDCTLLPERPDTLRLFLQFGAEVPTAEYHIQHILHRIKHFDTVSSEVLKKKLFWVKLVANDISHCTLLSEELRFIGNELIATLTEETNGSKIASICNKIEAVPSLKQLVRYRIRCCLRVNKQLPEGISQLGIDRTSQEYINFERIQ